MTPERWARLTVLFEAALDRDPADRSGFLAVACGDDEGLRSEVERLIESHEQAGEFGMSPAFRFEPAAVAAAAATEPLLTGGARLGRYQVLSLLGSGGMGEVYRACDPQLGREVGIKVLRRRHDVTAGELRRFAQEARAAGALHHPNVLAVYDIGLEQGVPFVVSELLHGETLRARIARGGIAADDIAAIARQILSGLAAAHAKDIIHRDLKPGNVFITTDGVVKILDFGLAKQMVPDGTSDPAVTTDGWVLGTAAYMAPEQVRGQHADTRTDVFSFGALLYELLTGRRAFTGESAVETMHAVLTLEPARIDSLPLPFRTVVKRCLAKDPGARFQSTQEIFDALAGPARPAEHLTPRRRKHLAIAAAIVIAALAGSVTLSRREPPPRPGATGRPALAVLPFDDRSGDPASAWLSRGVASMLVTSLAQTPGLDVIGTERLEASFRDLRRSPTDPAARGQAAKHAGAGALLVGTLYKAGDEIRVEVQLHDVDSGRIVAARSEQGRDVFGLVDAVARHVRSALDVTNRPAGRPVRDVTTASLEAYELYEKAQQARHNNRHGDARTLFEQALRVDPAFTLARAQLVNTLDRLGEDAAALDQRRIVASQIERLPERQRLLAEAVQEYDSDPARAIELLERLIERYPDEEEAYDALVHAYSHAGDPAYIGMTLTLMQRWARAIPGPGSGHFYNHYGYAYVDHGLFIEAEREFRAYIRVSPDEANAYDSLGELFLATGRPVMAVEQYDHALRLNPLFGWSRFGRAYALGVEGRYDEALQGMAVLQELGPRASVPTAVIHTVNALLLSRAGRIADAARHLDSAKTVARQLGDAGADADASLVEAVLALERGDYAQAVRSAERASDPATRAPVEIIRARRAAVAHLVAGIAETRAGRRDAARRRFAAMRALDVNEDATQASWRAALTGELALAEGRLGDAEQAFRAAAHRVGTSFAIYPVLVALGNNLPFRDGLARVAAARGEAARAAELYRRLNQPDATSTWISLYEPRYARTVAYLEQRAAK